MTATTVTIPDYVTIIERHDQPLAALAQVCADLLVQAGDKHLPPPRYLSVYHGGQDVSLGFGSEPGAPHALAQWAAEFGGTVTGTPRNDSDGQPQVYCQVSFIYGGVRVELCAFIPAEQAST